MIVKVEMIVKIDAISFFFEPYIFSKIDAMIIQILNC